MSIKYYRYAIKQAFVSILYPPGVWFADAMTSSLSVTFVFKEKSERP